VVTPPDRRIALRLPREFVWSSPRQELKAKQASTESIGAYSCFALGEIDLDYQTSDFVPGWKSG